MGVKIKTASDILWRIGFLFTLQALILLMISNYELKKEVSIQKNMPEITENKPMTTNASNPSNPSVTKDVKKNKKTKSEKNIQHKTK